MRRIAPAALVLLAAGCGGGSDAKPPDPPNAQRTPPATRQGEPRQARIIRAWSDALRRSDVERASTFFSLPTIVSQGRAARLRSAADVRIFNDGLPCGSRLVGVKRDGRYIVGTFRLTERPGKTCDGPGNLARVAFVFKGDRFSEWRQVVPQVPDGSEPEPPADSQAA